MSNPQPLGRTPLTIAFYVDSVPFTPEVVAGKTSLGGSESAGLGLARALCQLGHSVHVFATKLDDAVESPDQWGVEWHSAESELAEVFKFARLDVFISLRMPQVFALRSPAKLNLLWSQDMMVHAGQYTGPLSQVDEVIYVSEWHRRQWQQVEAVVRHMPDWVTTNGINYQLASEAFDAAGDKTRLAMGVAPRFIHISRPERGLDALLKLWPAIRARYPKATLEICRYSSMYDAGGWGQVCAGYDRQVQAASQTTGGITYLGELDKVGLYKAIAKAHLMLYPTSQPGFGETNCIACTESQACGTPFIGSLRGALPETLGDGAGSLVPGDWKSQKYEDLFLEAIGLYLSTPQLYREAVVAGRAHTARCDFGKLAEEWTAHIWERFDQRLASNQLGVLRRLLHDDNHVAGLQLAQSIQQQYGALEFHKAGDCKPAYGCMVCESQEAEALCRRVIAQEEQVADDYATHALADVQEEARTNGRMHRALSILLGRFGGKDKAAGKQVLDLACGNGSMSYLMEKAGMKPYGVDYSQVIERAIEAVPNGIFQKVEFGSFLGDALLQGTFDGAFCGEFLEHVEKPWELVDAVERMAKPGSPIVFTTPCGPFSELLDRYIPRLRGHLHSFDMHDIARMFGPKSKVGWEFLEVGISPQGTPVGYWVVSFEAGGPTSPPAGALDYTRRISLERPYTTIHAAMIVKDAEATIDRCLDALWGVADRVYVLDTGSRDRTVARIKDFTTNIPNWVSVAHAKWPEDFSIARNLSVEYATRHGSPDYIMWVDADEVLEGAVNVRKWVTGTGPFAGVAIDQFHFHMDKPNDSDRPCRFFRTDKGIRFYGVVHEQPEIEINKGIFPVIFADDVSVAHFGYTTPQVRTHKMRHRNLPLLKKELAGQGTHPPRDLAYVLAIRDYVNFAGINMLEEGETQITSNGRKMLAQAIAIYQEKGLGDPAHQLHSLAWPFYQSALNYAGMGVEMMWTFSVGKDLSGRKPRVEKFRALTVAEGHARIHYLMSQYSLPFKPVDDTIVPAAGYDRDQPQPQPASTTPSLEPAAHNTD